MSAYSTEQAKIISPVVTALLDAGADPGFQKREACRRALKAREISRGVRGHAALRKLEFLVI